MKPRLRIAVLLLAGAMTCSAADNEIGIYFDSNGTSSHLTFQPDPSGFYITRIYVVARNVTQPINGFRYAISIAPRPGSVSFLESSFLGGVPCSPMHCDPMYQLVARFACTCTSGELIVLQESRILVYDPSESVKLDVYPLNCFFVELIGFDLIPCGCHESSCTVPLTLAVDSAAFIGMDTVPSSRTSFGSVKALYK